jgi:superfamily II DNA or RNA helicase
VTATTAVRVGGTAAQPLLRVKYPPGAVRPVDGMPLDVWVAQPHLHGTPVASTGEWQFTGLGRDPVTELLAAGFDVPDTLVTWLTAAKTVWAHSGTRTAPPAPPPSDAVVPSWFGDAGGIRLFPYQVDGVAQICRGKSVLADAPGVGKTLQALAAAAALRARRTIIVCPPLVATHWKRETIRSGLISHIGCGTGTDHNHTPVTASIVAIGAVKKRAGHPAPALEPLPDAGVVIVGDSLLALRSEIGRQLISWQADVFIYDEVHRAKTWTSARARAARAVAASCTRCIPASGTPMFANPVEFASPLEMAKVLGPVFGGYECYTTTYARLTKFNSWTAKKSMIPQLREVLDEKVWVRRTKADVLPELPPKNRYSIFVDYDKSGYQAELRGVNYKIDSFLRNHWRANDKTLPDDDTTEAWIQDQQGLISTLRSAAGVAKIPAAIELIDSHLAGNPAVNGIYPRPITVWVHHHPVAEALAQAARRTVPSVASILGSTSIAERDRIVDNFQGGKVGVLIASIFAAGYGITLTRGSDAIFAETDWTPATIVQAEDRHHRIGTTAESISLGTLVAEGTLDESIHGSLNRKAEFLDSVGGGDNSVGVDMGAAALSAYGLLRGMVADRVHVGAWAKTLRKPSARLAVAL